MGLFGSKGLNFGSGLLPPPCPCLCPGVLPAARGSPEFSPSRQQLARGLQKLGSCAVHIALDSGHLSLDFPKVLDP